MTNGTQLAAALVVVVDRNRRIRNRMYGGVGGWRGQLRLLPDWTEPQLRAVYIFRIRISVPFSFFISSRSLFVSVEP